MKTRVFKIPDGQGGWKFQIQSPEGLWIDTDESGTPLTQDSPAGLDSPEPGPSRSQKETKKKGAPYRERGFVSFSVQIPREDYKALSDYVHWRALFGDEISKGAFLLKAGLDVIRKDRDYREFRKKNG